ncbi:glycosyltransferase [Candidatus Dojkabacteria bacterium]|nr:glycosyltransferase [Candidatus Dojkabacteria bacterium]
MITVILTSYKEPNTVAKAIESIADSKYSGYSGDMQFIQISPDESTLQVGLQSLAKISKNNPNFQFIQLEDPGKGKPIALNLGLKEAKGDIVIFTDGDVYFERDAVGKLVNKFERDKKIGAVTGRPVSSDSKSDMMGYYGHLFADANHYRRMIDLEKAPQEGSKLFVKRHKFFPMSGYIMAVKRELLPESLPEDALVDDAYISYYVFNQGMKIAYESEAIAYIKYPDNLSDYFKQKKRSTGGYVQLWKYPGIINEETKSRSFWHELEMFWFPFKYAKSIREFFWSLLLIPIRAWLWLQIIFEQRVLKKDFEKTWVRVESTK